jgi:hypothetical protein
MFTVVGRFRFRPMDQDEQRGMVRGIERDFAPLALGCPGFRSVHFSRPGDDEMMTTWLWDNPADWEAAQARFGPYLQQHIIPHLAQTPDRVGAEVVVAIAP